jgi:hypothetical protein
MLIFTFMKYFNMLFIVIQIILEIIYGNFIFYQVQLYKFHGLIIL